MNIIMQTGDMKMHEHYRKEDIIEMLDMKWREPTNRAGSMSRDAENRSRPTNFEEEESPNSRPTLAAENRSRRPTNFMEEEEGPNSRPTITGSQPKTEAALERNEKRMQKYLGFRVTYAAANGFILM
ncbi:hypothetical protein MA16_Dca011202 [Dendrobium catenatum]|uniref:Uncharacterized protein n=1 Tax=Dendrobium catenatum TaxID=906689 RepID=A0A2I0VIJ4_9ASPA|nr:hypothetical protein MA16_Dca011202 [Dendrobium catenatum]